MKILVIGGGGREHALAWKLARSSDIKEVLVTPGNAGTAEEPKCRNVNAGLGDIPALVGLAQKEKVELTVVGPEGPLVAGLVDAFEKNGLRALGPTAAAAQLEGSKAFSKAFCVRHHIPTSPYAVFSDWKEAESYIRKKKAPIVIKADGLAAGKGVTVAFDIEAALAACKAIFQANKNSNGGRVVIEDFLSGEEASFICLVNGRSVLPLATSQDHKRLRDGDKGPNTGGMGAYSPAPLIDRKLERRILNEIVYPTVYGLAEEEHPYRGFLYAGLMVDQAGDPHVLEFNCRLGDPETQPLLMRLRSDLLSLVNAAFTDTLETTPIEWDTKAALGVVLAAGGYPGNYRRGDEITGLDQITDTETKIFHAGTRKQHDRIVTNGGRVLCATSLGTSILDAQRKAYEAVEKIGFRDLYFRHDIGCRATAQSG